MKQLSFTFRQIICRVKEILLLASMPAILLITLYLTVAAFWLSLIVLANWTQIKGALLLPTAYTLIPKGLWAWAEMRPSHITHIIFAGSGWPKGAFAFIHAAGWDAVKLSWPYAFALAALWLVWGFRYNVAWVNTMASVRRAILPEQHPLCTELTALSISAGLQPPRLAVWREETPNAFASGLGKNSYTVTVTTGLLDILTPRERQAVLGHELGHIASGDVRLLTLCYVYGGIYGNIARYLWVNVLHSVRGDQTIYNRLFFSIPLVALFAGIFGLAGAMAAFVRILLLREREMRADAFSAKLTQHPEALTSALKKIRDFKAPPPEMKVLRESVIYRPFKNRWERLTSTHPTFERRLEAIDTIATIDQR